MEKKLYTTKEVSILTETHNNCLKAWIFEDFVRPLAKQEPGKVNTVWSREDVCSVAFLKYLIKKGYYRDNAAMLAKAFLKYYSQANLSTSKYFVSVTTAEIGMFYKCCNNYTAFVSQCKKNADVTDVSVFCLDIIFKDLFKRFKKE